VPAVAPWIEPKEKTTSLYFFSADGGLIMILDRRPLSWKKNRSGLGGGFPLEVRSMS
jgi:hypothetical protein